ncbi:hypothetical protein [Kineococcus glutinatus]|uniref:hypothetical protein n=1 Tax=Kineococcus glutinatus TaxID=1070872 RepID=UPI0031E51BDA
MKRRLRRPAAVAIAALSTAAVSGCAVFSPVQTAVPYEPSDGFSTTVGDVVVRNVLVVSEGDGAPGVLSATLVNEGTEDVEVTVDTGSGSDTSITVPTGVAYVLGAGSGAGPTTTPEAGAVETTAPTAVEISSVDAVAGELVPVTFEADGASVDLEVPVLLPRHEYTTLTPAPAPTDTGTATGTSTATSTATTTS